MQTNTQTINKRHSLPAGRPSAQRHILDSHAYVNVCRGRTHKHAFERSQREDKHCLQNCPIPWPLTTKGRPFELLCLTSTCVFLFLFQASFCYSCQYFIYLLLFWCFFYHFASYLSTSPPSAPFIVIIVIIIIVNITYKIIIIVNIRYYCYFCLCLENRLQVPTSFKSCSSSGLQYLRFLAVPNDVFLPMLPIHFKNFFDIDPCASPTTCMTFDFFKLHNLAFSLFMFPSLLFILIHQ